MATKQTVDRTGQTTSFTAEEKAAMKERAREMKAASRGADGAQDLQAKIAELTGSDRELAERIHAIISTEAPDLAPRTYYGMPAWARDGKVLCFFQPRAKFKVRYATFGFNEDARLDDGSMWPTSWALTELTPEVAARIADLVRKA
jgi:uncharacterized protein YdhG (YjbR/CyaY superfamily)